MKGYTHKGAIKTNGLVDPSVLITDPSKLNVSTSDDGFKLITPAPGNFEWWYFDVIDVKKDYVLKIVAHLGTDPLRRIFFPQVAISIKTPAQKKSFRKHYSLADFTASPDCCNVRIRDEFHAFVELSGKHSLYHIVVNMNGVSARLTFTGEIEGWKPLGNEVKMERGKKRGAFYWVIPLPRALVTGEFSLGNERYTCEEAVGYHDHNYWQADVNKKLFVDDVISLWYWGRVVADDLTVIIMDTHLKSHRLTSLMVARGNTIIHSSNNLTEVCAEEFREDREMKTSYPSRIMIRSVDKNKPFQMILNAKEIIDKQDLLEGTHPFIQWLIKLLVSRPVYYGISAESTVTLADKVSKGRALYEFMVFRNQKKTLR